MLFRWLASLGARIVTTVLALFLCICVDGWVRPQPGDGTYGMYGFFYGLIIAPLAGIAAAALVLLLMRHRAKRAEAATAPTHPGA